jgi:protein-tyrosine phosphatase
MIDIHHHCLPGVDDGPRDWSEAVDLCRRSAEEGIETIVATPHVMRGRWANTSREKLETILAELRERTGDTPRLLLGSEYFFAHDINEALAAGEIVPLAGGRYVLVEFAAHAVPPMTEQPLYRMQLDGWTPVIAHPERNVIFQSKPEMLAKLVRIGARVQVTSGSIVGAFGRGAQAAALEWIRRGLVHFVATDAHNTAKRPPIAREARRIVEGNAGAEIAEALFRSNPEAVVASRALAWEPELPYPVERPRFADRLKRMFGK